MSGLVDTLRSEFQNAEYRHAYAEECVNTMIATQIKVLREEREMTQSALADRAGMAQPRLSVMENADYSNWSINTLKRLARAFDVAISVKFETFSNVIMDFEGMNRENLSRFSFKDDPIFCSAKVRSFRAFRSKRIPNLDPEALRGAQKRLPFDVVELVPADVRNSRQYGEESKGSVTYEGLSSSAR